jgi:hypothetical protein
MFFAQETTDTLVTTTYSTGDSSGMAIFGGVYALFWLAIAVIMLAAGWKIFSKAGQAGWKILIPIYNIYIYLKIIGRPGWWLILLFIPFVNIIIAIIISLDLAKSFGRSEVFGIVWLFLISIVGHLILGFGSDKYVGPAAKKAE